MSKRIDLAFQHPKEEWDGFLGLKMTENHFDLLVDEDADVYTPEGEILFKFRKRALNAGTASQAYEVLRKIKQKTNNRGIATGKMYTGHSNIKKDGTLSKTTGTPAEAAVISNIIGFYDRYIRIPYCRQTAFNASEPEKWKEVLPFLQDCARVYASEAPERYALQQAVVDRTHPDWIIPKTPFTTITVNKNWQTAVHTDKGDLKDGLSLITAIKGGNYTGGYLVFPHYRAAVNLETCDLLMFNSHHMHGNTPIIGKINAWERVSLVLYFREAMKNCLSAEGEVEHAKNRKPGDPLW